MKLKAAFVFLLKAIEAQFPTSGPRPSPAPPPTYFPIDATNYQNHMCDDSFFVPTTPTAAPSPTPPPYMPPINPYYMGPPVPAPTAPTVQIRDSQDWYYRGIITQKHQEFCDYFKAYRAALKRKNTHPSNDTERCFTYAEPKNETVPEYDITDQDTCILRTGIATAQKCVEAGALKGSPRESDRYSWDATMPTLELCRNTPIATKQPTPAPVKSKSPTTRGPTPDW